ncbi:MAG: 2-polyprenyl-3-methyl-6-methoxy-1,4-benzoquinone monooxygenase [Nitrosomonadales bacterium]|nr:2-polyprenyl-3-methyl-6-methoxy-1,4-benzoquinone monooxygenase [Nitrosomonadales bacterium]
MIVEFDKGLRTLCSQAHSVRRHPDAQVPEASLSDAEKQHAAALMRVNHCGEICAQALYQGQALTARDPAVQQKLQHAAQEETEHLAWTAQRVHELGGHLSVLNPFWYTGALAMGAVAGLLGDRWNLGFLAETERQVGSHLQSHLNRLPPQDQKSRAIVAQMYADETNHAEMAAALGGTELPQPVQLAMKLSSRVMTTLTYRV